MDGRILVGLDRYVKVVGVRSRVRLAKDFAGQ